LGANSYRAEIVAVNSNGTFDLDVMIPDMKHFGEGRPFRIRWISRRKIAPYQADMVRLPLALAAYRSRPMM
jgi:hypothetical protein